MEIVTEPRKLIEIYRFKISHRLFKKIPYFFFFFITLIHGLILFRHPYMWRMVLVIFLFSILSFLFKTFFLDLVFGKTKEGYFEINEEGIAFQNGTKYISWDELEGLEFKMFVRLPFLKLIAKKNNLFSHYLFADVDLPGLKFALLKFCPFALDRLLIDVKPDAPKQLPVFGYVLPAKERARKKFKSDLLKGSIVLIATLTLYSLFKINPENLLGSENYNKLNKFMANTVVLDHNETYLGIKWPEGSEIGHIKEKPTTLTIQRPAKIFDIDWPAGTKFGIDENKVSYINSQESDFEAFNYKWPKTTFVLVRDYKTFVFSVDSNRKIKNTTVPSGSFVLFENSKPISYSLDDEKYLIK